MVGREGEDLVRVMGEVRRSRVMSKFIEDMCEDKFKDISYIY